MNYFLIYVQNVVYTLFLNLVFNIIDIDDYLPNTSLSMLFHRAALSGNTWLLNRIIDVSTNNAAEILAEDNFATFRIAALDGDTEIISRLIQLARDNNQLPEMLAAEDYAAFCMSVQNINCDTADIIAAAAPDQLPDMFSAFDFLNLDEQNFLHILVILIHIAREHNQLPALISANNCRAFRGAARNGYIEAMYLLIDIAPTQVPEMLAAIDYSALRWSAVAGELNVVNLLIATAVQYGVIVEMLRAESFLTFRLVALGREFAVLDRLIVVANSYNLIEELNLSLSSLEIQDFVSIDSLRHIALNRESSMRELSSNEKLMLNDAITHYQSQIDAQGTEAIIRDLQSTLAGRYLKNPAKIHDEVLPINWEDHQSKGCLAAYYNHKTHTAYRYFMQPNPWISPEASFVIRDELGARSCYDEHALLIALCFLAVTDESIQPTDEFTIENRLENFIIELALINRAHNWDKSRLTSEGKYEQYDDGEGDKPSCKYGLSSRLLQSVQGHPLFKTLTLEIIKQELRDFTREHFSNCIDANNNVALQDSWNNLIESGANDSTLDVLNISLEQQLEFIHNLKTKYQSKFTPTFEQYIREAFVIDDTHPNHASRFGLNAGIDDLLSKQKNCRI